MKKNSHRTVFALLLIVTVGAVAYSNTFNVPFYFDDNPVIVNNPIVTSFNYSRIGTRYLGDMSFALNYSIHGVDVTGYHAVNLLVHILNAVVLYFLVVFTFGTPFLQRSPIKKYAREIAMLSGLLFVSHPLQTQAVTYTVQRFASLASLFCMFSLLMYIRARGEASGPSSSGLKVFPYVLSVISAVCAMKTKEMTLTFPLIIGIYEFVFMKGKAGKRILYLVPLLCTMLIIPLSLVDIDRPLGDVIGDVSEVSREADNMPRLDYLYTQFSVLATYLRLIFIPVNQNLDYDHPVYSSFSDSAVYLPFLFLAAIFGTGVYLFRRYGDTATHTRLITFGIFWFFISLSVESSIIPIKDVIVEHRMYMPSAWVFVMISTSVYMWVEQVRSRWKEVEKVAAFILAVVIMASAGATYARNNIWKDEVSLWTDVVNKSPGKVRAYNFRGNVYLGLKEYDKALADFGKAIELDREYEFAYINRGNLYSKLRQYEKAISDYDQAIEINPAYVEAYNNRGVLYSRLGQYEKAITDYNRATELDPRSELAYNNRGIIYLGLEQYQRAIADFDKAIELNPDSGLLYPNRGNAYFGLNRYHEAIADYDKAIELDPGLLAAYINRGISYFKTGDINKAVRDYQYAARLGDKGAQDYLRSQGIGY